MIGALLIISVCTGMGLTAARSFKRAYMLLEEMCAALEILKSEICFSDSSLASAFQRVDKMTDTEGIFARAASKIGDKGVSRAWQEAVDESGLGMDDKSMLKLLCAKLMPYGYQPADIGRHMKRMREYIRGQDFLQGRRWYCSLYEE